MLEPHASAKINSKMIALYYLKGRIGGVDVFGENGDPAGI
jgi:hypothetical protein